MEKKLLNQDLFEKDIKKTILDSFSKGRTEMVKDAKIIINTKDGFKDKPIVAELLNKFIGAKSVEPHELSWTLHTACINDKVLTALEDIKTRYLNNIETYDKVKKMSTDVQIMNDKDIADIEDSFESFDQTLREMVSTLHDKFSE